MLDVLRPARCAAAAVLVMSAACGQDDGDGDGDDAPPSVRFTVRGTADGLWHDMHVRIESRSAWDQGEISVGQDGAFSMGVSAQLGATVHLDVRDAPPGFTCTLDRAELVATGEDITGVELRCAGPVTDIQLTGIDGWKFDPVKTSFVVTAPADLAHTDVTVVAPNRCVSVEVDHSDVWVTLPSVPVRRILTDGVNVVAVLAACDGAWRHFEVAIQRGDPAVNSTPPISAAMPVAGATLGHALAVSGNRVAVAAAGDADRGQDGSVAIHRVENGVLVPEATVAVPRPSSTQPFRYSVALSQDTLVVGMADTDAGGSVQVFRAAATGWTLEATLRGPPSGARFFGSEVAISGDVLVVAAIYDAAHIYRRVGTTWTEEARLTPPATHLVDAFATALTIEGDLIAVGAPSTTQPSPGGPIGGAGAVHLYDRSSGAWGLRHTVTALDPVTDARMGASLALGSGYLAIGAPWETVVLRGPDGSVTEGPAGAGAVYLCRLRLEPLGCDQLGRVVSRRAAANRAFGHAVSIDGDLLAVAAIGDTVGGPYSGAIETFRIGAGIPRPVHYLKAARPGRHATLGDRIAFVASMLLASASGQDVTVSSQLQARAGAVHVFKVR